MTKLLLTFHCLHFKLHLYKMSPHTPHVKTLIHNGRKVPGTI